MSTSPPPSPPAKRQKLAEAPAPTETISQLELERAVGITEYIDPDLKGWNGILKQRYTDFLVNEIDESGNVVHLTSLTVARKSNGPAKEAKVKVEVKEEKVEDEGGEDTPEFELSPADSDALSSLTSPSTTASLLTLYRSLPTPTPNTLPTPTSNTLPTPTPNTLTTPPIPSKPNRSTLHTLIRRIFSNKLDTLTLPTSQILITPSSPTSRRPHRGNRSGKNHPNPTEQFAPLGGEYCHFLLYKENRDTMQAISLISRLLRTGKKNNNNRTLSFAGTKDRRAVTVQRCSAYRVRAERLAALNNSSSAENGLHRGTRVGNFVYRSHGLDLGDLGGNEFCITLRECSVDGGSGELREVVQRAVESVALGGFVNYFGLQRFGSFTAGTWEVGVRLLKGEWRGAVEKILDYRASGVGVGWEDQARAEACELFLKQRDYKAAAEKIPRKFAAESTILRIFDERGKKGDGKGGGLDYLGALQAVPRNLRTMYSHAYQSYVWNHVASARVRMGMKVMEGDLVLVESARKEVEEEDEVDQDGEVVVNAREDTPSREQEEFQCARPLSREEAESGEYTMRDVVLPTPGWDVVYPLNGLLEVYKSVMAQHGLDPLDMRRSVKEHSLPGSYRKVIATFLDGGCGFEIKKYRGLEQVVKTDMEILEEAGEVKKEEAGGVKEEAEDKMEIEAEEKTAVVLRLKLGTSTYATMALRELMREGIKAYKPEFSR